MQKKNSSQWKRLWIGIIGGTVLIFGIALIVLPGPAFIVIPAGLAILATEFAWAAHWLEKMKKSAQNIKNKIKRKSP
jgi:uncharacterized protein (TIGR02611 family)